MRLGTWLRGMGIAAAIAACGGDDAARPADVPGAKDTIEFVLGPKTKQLTDADLAALQPGADTSQTLRFDASVGAKLARGDVLLGGVSPNTPRGLLRVVTKTTAVDGNVVEVETEQAPLQLAFQKLKVHLERTLDVPFELPPPLAPRSFEIGDTKPIQKFIFNGDDDPNTLEDQLAIDDRYTGKLGVSLDIDFDWGFAEKLLSGLDTFLECSLAVATLGIVGDCPDLDMPVLSATFRAQAMVAAEFDHAGAASAAYGTGKFPIGDKKQLPPITIGPLVFLPEVGFEGETKGRAGSYARFAGKSRAGFDLKITASTETGFDASYPSPEPTFDVTEVTAYLDGHVTTSVGPKLELLAYGAIGPSFSLTFQSDLDVDRTRVADCYRASLGLNANFGFVVRLPWRAIGEFLSGSAEIGEDVAWVARKFGLDKTLVDESVPFNLKTKQVGQGPCTNPPPDMLPPGAPQDDTLANPPFEPWARRYDEPGIHFDYSPFPHHARTRLVPGVDGHLWAPSAPSPTLRRIAIDGRQLSAVRYLAPIPDEDREAPLAVTDVLERADLIHWVLFENGTVARLGPDRALIDAFAIEVPHTDNEDVKLRRGAVRPDGRTALVFGIREISHSSDHRMVVVEMTGDGVIRRARAFGAPTASSDEVQKELFSNGQVLYRKDGSLLFGGDGETGTSDPGGSSRCHVMAMREDGSIAFAQVLSPGSGTCTFGALTVPDNEDIVITGNNGTYFGNQGYTIVLDPNGAPKTSAGFQLGGESEILPLYVSRLSTSGYIVAGQDTLSAARDGHFVARLDAQGVPLSTAGYRTPEGIQVGLLDAYVTKDAGVLFASLADWGDLAAQRETTRFLSGKVFAKNGQVSFNAASGMRMETLEATGNTLTTFATPLPYAFTDVPVKLVPKTPLRAEPLPSPETVFAP